MNRSKIEWCDHTFNPITGCRHNCDYCYARTMTARFAGDVRLNKMAKKDYRLQEARDGSGAVYVLDEPMLNETGNALVYPFGFEPTLHIYRSNTLDKLKMGNNIFVGAMADIFGAWVPDDWIDKVMEICMARPQHNYLFLTKNPERYTQYGVPAAKENLWYGTSVTKEAEMRRFNVLPADCKTFVSMEPILEDLQPEKHNILFRQVDWIIVGAETGRQKNKVIPEFEWIKKIVVEADSHGTPVFMKDSLIPIVGEKNMRRDYPKQLTSSTVSPKMKKKLYDMCSHCKAHLKKSEMITLLARSRRGEQPKQFGFMCKECFRDFCKELGLDIPELAELAESITIGPGEDGGNG
ncbi:MAG: phage Gp37/Gp68 family protein [Clostridiaceae bacterium]|nr:phage Gp37/Gp68 family protein [Clostridiaceae bacterium]